MSPVLGAPLLCAGAPLTPTSYAADATVELHRVSCTNMDFLIIRAVIYVAETLITAGGFIISARFHSENSEYLSILRNFYHFSPPTPDQVKAYLQMCSSRNWHKSTDLIGKEPVL